MWEIDRDTGMWVYNNEHGYTMMTTASTTTGAWSEILPWTDSGRFIRALDDFVPKPRCIFDE